MTGLVLLFGLIIGAVLQAVFPTFRWLGHAGAPVLLGLVIYYALTHPRGTMLMAAILAGLFQDALGLIPLGYSSFCFCVVGLAVGHYKNEVFAQEGLTHVLLGAVAAGVVTLMLYVLLSQAELIRAPLSWALLKTGGSMALGAVIVPLEFLALRRMDGMMGNLETRES